MRQRAAGNRTLKMAACIDRRPVCLGTAIDIVRARAKKCLPAVSGRCMLYGVPDATSGGKPDHACTFRSRELMNLKAVPDCGSRTGTQAAYAKGRIEK